MSDEFVVCQILQVGISWEVPVRNTNATRLQMQFVIDEKNRIIFFFFGELLFYRYMFWANSSNNECDVQNQKQISNSLISMNYLGCQFLLGKYNYTILILTL